MDYSCLGRSVCKYFLQSKAHNAFITACSAGPRALISVSRGQGWQEDVLHGGRVPKQWGKGHYYQDTSKRKGPCFHSPWQHPAENDYKGMNTPTAPQTPGCKEKPACGKTSSPFEGTDQVRLTIQKEEINWLEIKKKGSNFSEVKWKLKQRHNFHLLTQIG